MKGRCDHRESVVRTRRARPDDAAVLIRALRREWGATRVVSRGRLHDVMKLPRIVAELSCPICEVERRFVGLLSYEVRGAQLEVVSIQTTVPRSGVGSLLMERVLEQARASGVESVWLLTTNDNTPAQAFYASLGFSVRAVRRNAMTAARRLKPEIPRYGVGGVEIRDEIELELRVEPDTLRPSVTST